MYFKQFYLGCLSHASYLIGSEGAAVVVDPQRDVEQYIDDAATHGLKITHVLETHLHADFVSGHRELAERTGAEIIFGEKAQASFPHLAVKDGDTVRIGTVLLRILETPGHTPEGICVLVEDTENAAATQKLLTGDTLFIGDVGRPDLAGSKGYTAEQMAAMLYDSLHNKLMKLPDNVEVYPAHGAGSMCGRNISSDSFSTIGVQKQFNYALQPMSKHQFIAIMTTDLPEAPAYFAQDAEMNRTGAKPIAKARRPKAMEPVEVKQSVAQGASVLDVRPAAQFGNGHVPGALNIGLSGQFASWAGNLLEMTTPVVLVAEDEDGVDEAVLRLARVGIESVAGYLQGGMYAWDKAGFDVVKVPQMPVDELNLLLQESANLLLLDVRRPGEYSAGHVPEAKNAELSHLAKIAEELDKYRPVAVMCQSGYRSAAACSVLQNKGFANVSNVVGGMSAWSAMESAKAVNA